MSLDAMKQALSALEQYTNVVTSINDPNSWVTVADGGKPARDAISVLRAAIEQAQEPVAWVYPEGLEALKAGKPWTAYGTRQEPNNTALYLSPQPDIAPYAWVTFTPYGDEDDVWYENPEGKLLEGWTYKPLYDSTPPQRKPLSEEEIQTCRHMIDWTAEWSYINFARAIEAAHGIKGEA